MSEWNADHRHQLLSWIAREGSRGSRDRDAIEAALERIAALEAELQAQKIDAEFRLNLMSERCQAAVNEAEAERDALRSANDRLSNMAVEIRAEKAEAELQQAQAEIERLTKLLYDKELSRWKESEK